MSKVSIGRVRQKVREALMIAPGYGKTESMLLEAVNELVGGGVDLQMLRDGIEYNHGETFIRSKDDEETEQRLWFITKEGIARENIK
ncbi:hypothetical protein JIN85_16960 [Luteolibacter pohnpeiensis]|uniref:Uncharacterized protein n=1 Tax=Luteolibacter pohnpeiensis TaxID=454153 RepID=A0A934S965_9BACT|nr:hypothetical protein [Luteolibacter pohnpeiensis]MBK1884113.1 hypothetical protein [Luteolibacter pohnpeiensis]